jgi:hypothetical protein
MIRQPLAQIRVPLGVEGVPLRQRREEGKSPLPNSPLAAAWDFPGAYSEASVPKANQRVFARPKRPFTAKLDSRSDRYCCEGCEVTRWN